MTLESSIINTLLSDPKTHELVNSVIITLAPTWLGKGGVKVSPDKKFSEKGSAIPALIRQDVTWVPLGRDVVFCGCLEDSRQRFLFRNLF